MEFQALRVEIQLQKTEHAAHLAFEVGDQFLVLDAQHTSGQHFVPVAHQCDIGLVVAPDVLQAISEFLALGKQLLEVAEAAGHRFAARIDDPRARQDQVDQADMPEIIRHLVDKVRFFGPAVNPRIGDVLFAELAKVLARQVRQRARVSKRPVFPLPALELVHDPRNVCQLHRAFDALMCGKYLFDQCRA